MTDYSRLRERMVQRQIAGRGVRSEKVLNAMRTVPRERFLPKGQGVWAYDDAPLPIGDGQTISQPFIVAYMTEALALDGSEKAVRRNWRLAQKPGSTRKIWCPFVSCRSSAKRVETRRSS